MRARTVKPRSAVEQPRDVLVAVADALTRTLPAGGRIAVALSGGRDSVALLDASTRVADAVGCDVMAFHVDHRLSAHSGGWSRFCSELCAMRGVRCHLRSVDVERGPGISVEAAARTVRYAALADLAREHAAAAVLLAHQADDQAETVLLQLLRGAGPRGLAAMAEARFDAGIWWLRPFLALPRARLDAYAREHALAYVDDDSNADSRYRRNALRRTVVPALRTIAPGYPATLVRAAGLQADAAALLDDLARVDGARAYDGVSLDRAALAALDARRARNLLRWFLRERELAAASSARLSDMVRQLTRAADDARLAIGHAGATLGVHRGRIFVHRSAEAVYARDWHGTEAIELPHGTLRLTRGHRGGIAERHVGGSRVTIRSGVDGERLQAGARASRRRVADLLREAGVPSWDRQALPRVYCNDVLAAVATLGVDAAFAAVHGEPAFALDWHPFRSAS